MKTSTIWITLLLVEKAQCQLSAFIIDDVDCILGSDLFTPELEILSASVGFEGSIGVGTNEQDAIDFGLAWNYLVDDLTECPVTGGDISAAPLTSAQSAFAIQTVYDCKKAPDAMDGYPICFSWPVLPCSIRREHIKYKRTDGAVINPNCIGPSPNQEFNERHCIVIFDDFITRDLPGENGRLGMDRVDIVGDLLFVGPEGQIVSGKGLSRVAPLGETPYASGPVFVGGRLSPLDEVGEGNAEDFSLFDVDFMPNSGVDLFGENSNGNLYRLRLFYSGGMTPDGLTSNFPNVMFDDYLVLQFENGVEIDTYQTSVQVTTTTSVTVLGVADLGLKQDVGYDICYAEDRDNYFDVILDLDGDESVFRNIKIRAFSKGKFLFNPGGPGPTPFDDVRYTAPSPADQLFAVRVDLENVHRTTFCLNKDNKSWSRDRSMCEAWREAGELHKSRVGSFFNGPLHRRSCPAGLLEQVNSAIAAAPNVTTGRLDSRKHRGIVFFVLGFLGALLLALIF